MKYDKKYWDEALVVATGNTKADQREKWLLLAVVVAVITAVVYNPDLAWYAVGGFAVGLLLGR